MDMMSFRNPCTRMQIYRAVGNISPTGDPRTHCPWGLGAHWGSGGPPECGPKKAQITRGGGSFEMLGPPWKVLSDGLVLIRLLLGDIWLNL